MKAIAELIAEKVQQGKVRTDEIPDMFRKSVSDILNRKEIVKMENVIKVKYFGDTEPLVKSEKGDMVDLRAAATMKLKKGEYYHIPLGVAMQLPEGKTALVVPRSSTFKNWGILQTNSVGVIDNSYCGDLDQWQYPVWCTRDTTINRGDRICQFMICDTGMSNIKFETVKHLDGDNRSGFGSTGVM